MWMYAVGGVVLVVAILFVWGVLHLRHSQETALAAIRKVALPDVERLRLECEHVFSATFSETLALDDLERSARLLSDRLDQPETLKAAFAKEGFYWYFVLPVGAYVGELLRVHARGEWRSAEHGGLEMSLPVGGPGDSATTYPFDKVIKQVTIGDKGDLYAYLKSAIDLDAVISDAAAGES